MSSRSFLALGHCKIDISDNAVLPDDSLVIDCTLGENHSYPGEGEGANPPPTGDISTLPFIVNPINSGVVGSSLGRM